MSSGQEIREIEEGKSRKNETLLVKKTPELIGKISQLSNKPSINDGRLINNNNLITPNYELEDEGEVMDYMNEREPLVVKQPKGKSSSARAKGSSLSSGKHLKSSRPRPRNGRSRSRSKSPGHSLYDDPYGDFTGGDLFDESFLNKGPMGGIQGAVPTEPKVMYKRNKKGILKPVVVNQPNGSTGSGLSDWKEGIQPQSARAGWIDEQTDDSDNSDVFRAVRKPPSDSTFQIYVILAVIVLITATVGSVKLWEFFYGKPKIKENFFDFSVDPDKDD